MECLKFIMFGFNVVFWLIGGAMLGLGIWMAVDPDALNDLGAVESAGMDNEMWAIAVYTFIAIGALVFLLGFLGCWGACISESSSIALWIYSILVGLIILAEIAVVILVAIYWGSVNDSVAQAMYNDVRTKYIDDNPEDALYTSWNVMQTEWECCGSYNYTDYIDSAYDHDAVPASVVVPQSCCTDTEHLTECQSLSNKDYVHSKGCYDAMKEFLDKNAPIIIGVTCGFAALQIIGLIFACCLIHDKKHKGKYV